MIDRFNTLHGFFLLNSRIIDVDQLQHVVLLVPDRSHALVAHHSIQLLHSCFVDFGQVFL
jgi:hypothetical protein